MFLILTSLGPQEFHSYTTNMTANTRRCSLPIYAFLLHNQAVQYEVFPSYLLVQHQWMHVMLNARGWVPTAWSRVWSRMTNAGEGWLLFCCWGFWGFVCFSVFCFVLQPILLYQKEAEGRGRANRKSTPLVAGKESQRRSLSKSWPVPKPDRQPKSHHCQLCTRQHEESATWIFSSLVMLYWQNLKLGSPGQTQPSGKSNWKIHLADRPPQYYLPL